MPFVSSAGARAPRRGAAASFLVLFFVGSALSLVGASSASAAGVRTLYAYGGGGATSPTSCPKTTTASEKCTLAEALALSVAGSTVALATPGSKGHYIGNWTVSTRAFSASAPVTLKPAPGVADPTLDGNQGKATNCQTKTCDGPVLTLASGVHMDLDGVTLQGADNTGRGGAIDNGGGGTLSVSACRFSDNRAVDGGAIDNGDRGGGVLTVSASTFSGNTAGSDGGAEHWAIAMTLIQTAKLNGVNPMAWLTDVLERVVSGETKANELHQLLPWNWVPSSALMITPKAA